ncbi:MAG: twin-arginine translocation pathway signal [Bradyrhizobium sp.]
MIARIAYRQPLLRAAFAVALLALGGGLAGCAGSMGDMGDNMTTAFADPAKYEYYDCKQLENERKNIKTKLDELQRLMVKADTGVAGPVVAELAYRNDYIAYRGQSKFADEAWRRNKCHDSPPAAPGDTSAAATPVPPANAKGARSPSRSGSAVY